MLIAYAFLAFGFLAVVTWQVFVGRRAQKKPRRHRSRPGAGTVGTIYDMLNEDQRRAMEIVVEGKAGARRPEYPDGNLPDLESPKK